MFSYYTQEERKLLEKAAKLERRQPSAALSPSPHSTERKGSLPVSKRPYNWSPNSQIRNATIMQCCSPACLVMDGGEV